MAVSTETMPSKIEQTILSKIQSVYPSMTKGQQQLADYILDNSESVIEESISSLMSHTDLKSEASVVKFYRLLGFDSFQSFKITLAQDLANARAGKVFYHSNSDITMDDDLASVKQKVFSGAANVLDQNRGLAIDECIHALDIISTSRRIILLGLGGSAPVCQYAQFRFTELGLVSYFNPDSHTNASVLTHPQYGDVVFCISQSGENADLYKLSTKAHENNIPIILLTGTPDSSIGELSDVVILTQSNDTHELTESMTSRITQFCSIDALFCMFAINNFSFALPNLRSTRDTYKEYKI